MPGMRQKRGKICDCHYEIHYGSNRAWTEKYKHIFSCFIERTKWWLPHPKLSWAEYSLEPHTRHLNPDGFWYCSTSVRGKGRGPLPDTTWACCRIAGKKTACYLTLPWAWAWAHWRIQTCVLGGPTHAGVKPRVPPNPVFSSDLGHLFFVTALTRWIFF